MSSADVIDDDELPRLFGSYLLLENFARGGMGDVYLAKSGGIAGLERTCVLKKLRTELSQDREYVTRFVDEARVVVTLNHANICNVFDVGRVHTTTSTGPVDEYYLAMEYVSGRDLRTLLDRCRKLGRGVDVTTAVHLVCEVLKALDYAHRRRHPVSGELLQLVHRDVSPQNVLVSYEGEVKLIDFGLAASRLKVERTQPNVVMGKMAYMPPEQARGDPIDARADLFACGVLLYELVSNERYYEGMTANDIWQVAGRGGFVPRALATIDPALQGILGRALHPDARRRMNTCGELREELLSFAAIRNGASAERTLRTLMESLFSEEIAREHAAMARFGPITIAAYRSELHSVPPTTTLVAAVPGSHLDEATTHDAERPLPPMRAQTTTEEGTPMPSLSSSSSLSLSSSSSSSVGGLHDDPTRLQQRPDHLLTASDDRAGLLPGDGRIHDERTVLTQPVPRTPRPMTSTDATEFVRAARREPLRDDDDIDDELTALQVESSRRRLWLAVAGAVALLVIGGVSFSRCSPDVVVTPVAATPVAATPVAASPDVVSTGIVAAAIAPATAAPQPVEAAATPAEPVAVASPAPPAARVNAVKTSSRDKPNTPRPVDVAAAPTETSLPKPAAPPDTTKSLVTGPQWDRFSRDNIKSPCVNKLISARVFSQEGAFLQQYSAGIRACASSLGKQL